MKLVLYLSLSYLAHGPCSATPFFALIDAFFLFGKIVVREMHALLESFVNFFFWCDRHSFARKMKMMRK